MFNEDELKQFQNEIQNLNINFCEIELKIVLEFMYSIGVIAYDFINNN